MGIAEKIVALRGKESRAKFAAKLGINANTLRNYESGQSLPNSDVLAKICQVSGVDPAWLLCGIENTVENRNDVFDLQHSDGDNFIKKDMCSSSTESGSEITVELPPTSTIEDNESISTEIDEWSKKLDKALYNAGSRHHDVSNLILRDFSIPNDAKYKFYPNWPEAAGRELVEYLQDRVKAVEANGRDSIRTHLKRIPSDEELCEREAKVFQRLRRNPTSNDVSSWFTVFFGKDAKIKRSRFSRWIFVLYAENYISSLR